MIIKIEKFIAKLFGFNSYIATFFTAMIPLIELKGAVPFGMSKEIFGAKALDLFSACIASAIGSFVPAIFLILLFKPLISYLKKTKVFKKVTLSIENRFQNNADKLSSGAKKSSIKKYLALILFVAIPLPLTGAYTGSAVASLMGISYFAGLVCILIGNLICALIMALFCTIFKGYENYILLSFLLLLLIFILARIIINYARKKKSKKEV